MVSRRRISAAIAAGSLFMITVACTVPSSPDPEDTSSPTSEPAPSSLLTYDETDQGIPVTAQYPDSIEVESQGSGEGVGVYFTFEPQGSALDDAAIQVFLPSSAASTDALMPMITGDNGLIANNGWTLEGSRADTASEFPYPWFEMVFDISTGSGQAGHILIGQAEGQAIQVILLYPPEMAEAYWSAANTVLDSMEFDASLLPIDNSEARLDAEAAELPEGTSLSSDGQTLVMAQFSLLEAYCMEGRGKLAISYVGEAGGDHQLVSCGATFEAFDAARESRFADANVVEPAIANSSLQLQAGEYARVECLGNQVSLEPVAAEASDGHMTLNCL